MKKINIAVSIGLIISILLTSVTTFAKELDDIREQVLRLHILANSNTDDDQNLKLKVRDAILDIDSILSKKADNLEEAKTIFQEFLPQIKKVSEDIIHENGYSYKVDVEMANLYFPTREYEDFVLPAGYYDALRVQIGEAKGDNWWCVLYPPLCLPAATDKRKIDDAFNKRDADIVTNKNQYEFKFAVVELYQTIKDFFTNK